ncbi:MAG TPA: chemotaxis protein CheW [Desulfobacteria bacterium]|nr:chemotaxis protein CheW [Desulfobacteria bacterium]
MEDIQLVTCAVNGEEYAVEIEYVQEIIRVTHVTRMPFGPEYLPGVMNLRGRIIPVMDMAKRLTLPDLTLSDLSRIIVVSSGDITAGLLVDQVAEIVKLDISHIESRDVFSSVESSRYFKGVGKIGERVLLIIDLEKIFEIYNIHEV